MKAHVVVHVRELPGGPAVVTPVQFNDLSLGAASVAAALDALRPQLQQRLEWLDPVDGLPYATPPDATLLRVPVEVHVGGKKGEPVEITVAVVALARVARGRRVLVARVPAVAGLELLDAGGDVERLVARVAKKVAAQLRSW